MRCWQVLFFLCFSAHRHLSWGKKGHTKKKGTLLTFIRHTKGKNRWRKRELDEFGHTRNVNSYPMVFVVFRLGDAEDRLFKNNILEPQNSRVDLLNRIEHVTKIPIAYQEIKYRGDELPDSLHPLETINEFEELTVENQVTVSVHQHGDCKLEGQFVFISLDAKNPRKKYAVNQLIPTNDLEEQTIEMRQRQYLKQSVPPTLTVLEQPLIKENQVRMSSTKVEHTRVVQPENENPYGTAFGGFLLRQGLETAEACARLFAKVAKVFERLRSAEIRVGKSDGSVLDSVRRHVFRHLQVDPQAKASEPFMANGQKILEFGFRFGSQRDVIGVQEGPRRFCMQVSRDGIHDEDEDEKGEG
ncbi:unnamed protein product [Caenorhabditis auriculariae]|uniref:Ubiquitin-like domain-containing protein n=1 Tax=Caenorhabditis auriculariae TaxID=2777116 RepID=A0A8S1GWN7_9PELO|nr:unnamed protein product [Caenorhabditis auriculariae]